TRIAATGRRGGPRLSSTDPPQRHGRCNRDRPGDLRHQRHEPRRYVMSGKSTPAWLVGYPLPSPLPAAYQRVRKYEVSEPRVLEYYALSPWGFTIPGASLEPRVLDLLLSVP